jgi:hypothetical protein
MLNVLNFIVPTTLSLIALCFSVLSFRRDRTFHNENSLYEAKLEAYRAIIRLITHYLNEVEDLFQPLVDYQDNLDQELLKKIGEKEEFADQVTFKLKNDLTEYRFLASAAVDEKLDHFIDFLLYSDPSFETREQYIEYGTKVIDDLYGQAEKMAKVMHGEMNIGPLNENLFKRLSKKATRIAIG